jgi:hypothetical protein
MIVILSMLACLASTQEFLNNIPITFSLSGTLNYIPTSGGVPIQGYSIAIGFDRYSWLGTFHSIQVSSSKLSPPLIIMTPSSFNVLRHLLMEYTHAQLLTIMYLQVGPHPS